VQQLGIALMHNFCKNHVQIRVSNMMHQFYDLPITIALHCIGCLTLYQGEHKTKHLIIIRHSIGGYSDNFYFYARRLLYCL